MSDDPNKKIRHDLRTPINQILGYSELLEEQAQDEGDASYIPDLQKIQTAARRLLELIEAHFGAPTGAAPAPQPSAEETAPSGPVPAGAAEARLDAGSATPPAGGARVETRLPSASPSSSGIRDAGSGRLLVVDDNEMNRDMLARRLAGRGYTVETAEDGSRALERLEQGGVDLVLLDVMMPGMSGLSHRRGCR
jgi:sigma-B regulation protein RsbU (phosphoserine phosphatase)